MIELREAVSRVMSRDHCLMHCMMILASLDRIEWLIEEAKRKCEDAKDD